MASPRKVIITCAITGAIHTPSMSPHLPVTPEDVGAWIRQPIDNTKVCEIGGIA